VLPTRTHIQAALDWLLRTEPQANSNWMLRDLQLPKSLAAWTLLGVGAHKEVYRLQPQIGGETAPIIMKRGKGSLKKEGKMFFERQLAWAQNGRPEQIIEILYLEYLRHQPGVPELLGGYIEQRVPHNRTHTEPYLVWLLRDTGGSPIWGKNVPSTIYESLAREKPVELAIAILRCFRSFSDVGGFFMRDLLPKQFVVTETPVNFLLIDAPEPHSGLVASVLGASVPYGYGGQGHPVELCLSDVDCRHTPSFHRCSTYVNGSRVPDPEHFPFCGSSLGAPEAMGHCNKAVTVSKLPKGITSRNEKNRCSPLTAKTHIFDLATKPWLLPFMANQSQIVQDLLPLMKVSLPSRRLSFSDCIRFLQKRVRGKNEHISL